MLTCSFPDFSFISRNPKIETESIAMVTASGKPEALLVLSTDEAVSSKFRHICMNIPDIF